MQKGRLKHKRNARKVLSNMENFELIPTNRITRINSSEVFFIATSLTQWPRPGDRIHQDLILPHSVFSNAYIAISITMRVSMNTRCVTSRPF